MSLSLPSLRSSLLVAPMTSPACEGGACRSCSGRELRGRILNVCLCPCHLGAREGGVVPAPPPEDPLAAVAVEATPARQTMPSKCPRCSWPEKMKLGLSLLRLAPASLHVDPEAAYQRARAVCMGDDPGASGRAARKEAKRRAAGLCLDCAKLPPVAGSVRCPSCLEKRRERKRRYTGCAPWAPGRPGRPPLTAASLGFRLPSESAK